MSGRKAITNARKAYASLDAETRARLDWWIREYIRPAESENWHHTSYGLKHLLHSSTRIYVTNDQFKGAMLVNGYQPIDAGQSNWRFRMRNVILDRKHQAEAVLEKDLSRRITELGGRALKFVSPGWTGAPDRMVLVPGGMVVFVELKRHGERPRPLQVKRHQELRNLGFQVRVLDSQEECDAFLEEFFPHAF